MLLTGLAAVCMSAGVKYNWETCKLAMPGHACYFCERSEIDMSFTIYFLHKSIDSAATGPAGQFRCPCTGG